MKQAEPQRIYDQKRIFFCSWEGQPAHGGKQPLQLSPRPEIIKAEEKDKSRKK